LRLITSHSRISGIVNSLVHKFEAIHIWSRILSFINHFQSDSILFEKSFGPNYFSRRTDAIHLIRFSLSTNGLRTVQLLSSQGQLASRPIFHYWSMRNNDGNNLNNYRKPILTKPNESDTLTLDQSTLGQPNDRITETHSSRIQSSKFPH
jgi:hypothetical protein